MITETTWQMHCPLAQKQIKLTELNHVEGGGSCQIDINAGEVSCSEQEVCEYRTRENCPMRSVLIE